MLHRLAYIVVVYQYLIICVSQDEGKTTFADVMSKIVLTTDISKAQDCDLIIEVCEASCSL